MFSELKWLLPEGVDEVLPDEARVLEALRRGVLDLLSSWGYELVDPPLIEYLDSLLSGVGEDLDLQTCKLVDQASGRLLGVRADMTPQVARIDAHRLKRQAPARLCYVGPVLHNIPDRFLGSRNPLQIGAELYGYGGVEADIEIGTLLIKTLETAGFSQITLDVGHVGIVRSLVAALGLDNGRTDELRDILNRKATPELSAFLQGVGHPSALLPILAHLPSLNGGVDVVDRARALLSDPATPPGLTAALDELDAVVSALSDAAPAAKISVDLAETRGFRYHTGLTFSAFVPGEGQEVAWGGRYNDIGSVFGEARPATGFSTDLKRLSLLKGERCDRRAILAPADPDPNLAQTIAILRSEGACVVQALPGAHTDPALWGCSRRLVRVDDGWRIEDLNAD